MKREVATPAVTPGSGRARERAYATLGPCAVRAAGAAPGKWAEYRRNAALPSVSIRELKVDAARFGIDARGMEKAELAAAVDAARAASEARKLERPAKKRKTERKPPRGKFVLDPEKISFNLDIKLVPQSEDDRLYALRLMDTYTKDVTAEQSEAIINTPRAEYLATQTQKDRDALKKEHWAVQADILCKAPIASVRVDDVRFGPWSAQKNPKTKTSPAPIPQPARPTPTELTFGFR